MGNKKGLLKSILPWLIVLMVISVAIPFFNQSESSEIRYDKFIEIVQKEKVKDVEIVPKSLVIDVRFFIYSWLYTIRPLRKVTSTLRERISSIAVSNRFPSNTTISAFFPFSSVPSSFS